MDSRAKQRLTGAVILVALFVLLVPELLTGPREADAPEGAAADEGMRRYTIDLDASAPPAQPEISPAQPAVALPPVADDRAKPGDEAAPATPRRRQRRRPRRAPPRPSVATTRRSRAADAAPRLQRRQRRDACGARQLRRAARQPSAVAKTPTVWSAI